MHLDDFYEELPTEEPVVEPKTDEPAKDEPVRAHILSPEEMEQWKNGGDTGPTLRHAADVEAEKEPDKPVVKTEAKEEPVAALPQPTLEDPGEYAPADYSFEVTIYDADTKNPKQVKIASVEEFDQLLENDSNFGSYAALAKAQRKADRMEADSDRDKAQWEAAKAEYETEAEQVTERVEQLNNIAAEMDYLVGKGKLPAITDELKNANWQDPEIAAQAGVKEQLALLKYMDKESADRRKAGLAPLVSPISALREMQLDEAEKGTASAQQRQVAARKAAGAKVGGTSPAPATSAPKGISVGRVARGGLRGL
jgi:hypothetical protein